MELNELILAEQNVVCKNGGSLGEHEQKLKTWMEN